MKEGNIPQKILTEQDLREIELLFKKSLGERAPEKYQKFPAGTKIFSTLVSNKLRRRLHPPTENATIPGHLTWEDYCLILSAKTANDLPTYQRKDEYLDDETLKRVQECVSATLQQFDNLEQE